MDATQKKTSLRMIPYGLYLLTAEASDGKIACSTINFVTQTSFEPPLIVAGVKNDSLAHSIIKDNGVFALNILGKDQKNEAYTFFKHVEPEGQTLGGLPFTRGKSGSPVFESCPAYIECELVDTVEKGDHSIFVGEVVNASVNKSPEGRIDEATLWMMDLGKKVYYGG